MWHPAIGLRVMIAVNALTVETGIIGLPLLQQPYFLLGNMDFEISKNKAGMRKCFFD